MTRTIAALLLLLAVRPDALAGQAATPASTIVPGARVRIRIAGEEPRIARVVAHTGDTLHVRWPEYANVASVPLAQVSTLDVSVGRHRNVLKGMALGTVAGGAIGAAIGAFAYQPCTSTEFLGCFLSPTSRMESAEFGAIVVSALGLVVGGLAGLQSHDTWKRVPQSGRRVGVSVSPRARGAALGVAMQF
jgi:hypothetical protein